MEILFDGRDMTCNLTKAPAVVLLAFSSLVFAAQPMVLNQEDVIDHVRQVVQQGQPFPIKAITCPEEIPMRAAEITECRVTGEDGRNIIVYVEQTDDQGGIYGSMYDPEAGKILQTANDAFQEMLRHGIPGPYYDTHAAPELRAGITREKFSEMVNCRLATIGKISDIRVLNALLADNGQDAYSTLYVRSAARPLRIKLFFGKGEDKWRLKGMNLAAALPLELPQSGLVTDRAKRFIVAYNAQNWEAALSQLSPEFEMAGERLRPRVELALKRGFLGPVEEAAVPQISIRDNGVMVATTSVKLTKSPADIVLQYQMCGPAVQLNGYQIQARPEHPLEMSADYASRVLELEIWRGGHGEVEVSCKGPTPIRVENGTRLDCDVVQNGRTFPSVIEFTSNSGDFRYRVGQGN